MKPRKINPHIIFTRDANRAFRFYRDLFDFLQDGPQDARFLKVDGQAISFENNDEVINIEIIARDHQDEVKNHLINYFLEYTTENDARDETKIRFLFDDSEGNHISLQVNK
jgi:predicted enzyme related to lactoylglutathione lyase